MIGQNHIVSTPDIDPDVVWNDDLIRQYYVEKAAKAMAISTDQAIMEAYGRVA